MQARAVNMYARTCGQLAHDFGIMPLPERATRDEAEAIHAAMSIYHHELSEAQRERMKQEAGRKHA